MPYLVIDTETSGLPDWKLRADAEGQPRIASWCFLDVDDDLEILHRYSGLVKPDGWEMPPEASAVNGLTQEVLLEKGSSIEKMTSALLFHLTVGNYILVAHNLQFDTKMLRGELRRIEAFSGSLGAQIDQCKVGICTMRGLMQACAIPKPNGNGIKFPRLTEACKILLGRDLPGAHDAVVDAKACLWLLRVMRDRGLLVKEAA